MSDLVVPKDSQHKLAARLAFDVQFGRGGVKVPQMWKPHSDGIVHLIIEVWRALLGKVHAVGFINTANGIFVFFST